MTILLTTDHYPPHVNGIVTHVALLRDALRKRGHRVIILTPRVSEGTEKDVYFIPSYPLIVRPGDTFSSPYHPSLEKELASLPIDVVHNHLFITGYMGKRIAKKRNIPLVGTLHTFFSIYAEWILPWAKPLTRPLMKQLTRSYFNDYDLVLAPSEKAEEELTNAHVTSPIQMLHNAIDMSYSKNAHAEMFRKAFGITHAHPLLILVGAVEKRKNVTLAIQTIRVLREKFPKILLAIIGDGNIRAECEQLVKKYNLEENVLFTGFVDPKMVAHANKASDLSLFTSDKDNFPTVLIEALAAGKPIVAVKDKAVKDLVHNKRNGLLANKDPHALAEAVTTILTDTKKKTAFGNESLSLAKAYSIDNYAAQLEHIYHDLIAKR